MESLKKAYLSNKAKNLYLGHELCTLLKQFYKENIEVIVLKGAALAHIIYPDFGLRKYGDINILIKNNERHIVEKLMHEFGYVSKENYNKQKKYKEMHFHLAPYFHFERNTYVEIHWNITNQFPLRIDKWWERSKKEKILVSFANVFSPDDLLKHLCIHITNHSFLNFDLRTLCDISETIKYYGNEIDWKNLQKQVEKYPISTEVYSILYYIKKKFFNNANYLNWLNYKKADLKLVSLFEELIFRPDRDCVCPDKISLVLLENSLNSKVMVVLKRSLPKTYFYYLMRPLILLISRRKYLGKVIIDKAKEILIKTSYTLRWIF
jgi:hypothetical protein